MILSRRETQALARTFAMLAEDLGERDVRLEIGRALLDLLQADHFASYVWDAALGRFADGVSLHMDPANLAHYEQWFQFRDPITFLLQARRHATAVSEVMPHVALARTEFFNDFLARDGLHWGINLHAFDGESALGDLRKTAGGTDTIGNLNSILASAPALNAVVESGMLRPEVMGTLAELGDCVVEGRARATEQGTKVGPFGIVGALRDDDVQKGMGLLIEIARALGKRL